jgi:hypothetical protein
LPIDLGEKQLILIILVGVDLCLWGGVTYSINDAIEGGSELFALLAPDHMDVHEDVFALVVVVRDVVPEGRRVEVAYALIVDHLIFIEVLIADEVRDAVVDSDRWVEIGYMSSWHNLIDSSCQGSCGHLYFQ